MADPQIVSQWLKKADEDLEFAISVIEDSTFYAQICFHFHQAAEKYLKSFIIARDLEFKKIHDLTVLLKSCLSKKPDLKILMDDCRLLNGFYIDTHDILYTGRPNIRRRRPLRQKRLQNISVAK